jgi:Rho-binding antiterminator
MKSGAVFTGVALDTSRDEQRRECLVLSSDGLVVLDEISTLEVCVDNPHFDRISLI